MEKREAVVRVKDVQLAGGETRAIVGLPGYASLDASVSSRVCSKLRALGMFEDVHRLLLHVPGPFGGGHEVAHDGLD